MPALKEKFDGRFERHFAAYLLRDNHLMSIVRKYLEPEYFSNEVIRNLVKLVNKFWDENGSVPGEMIQVYLGDAKKQRILSEDMYSILSELCRDMLEEELQNANYLLTIYDHAIRHLAFDAAMPSVMQHAANGDFEEALSLLQSSMADTPKGKHSIGEWYTTDPTDRIERRLHKETDALMTLIAPIDAAGAYICRGQIGILQGAFTGIGKSVALGTLARNAVFQGKKVAIISLELSEAEYWDRMDMCVGGMTTPELSDGPKLRERIRRVVRDDRSMIVKQFPSGKTKVSELKAWLKELQDQHNFYPDLVMVDYDDLLEPSSSELRSNLYAKGADIYNDLRGWCVEENFGMWIACQSTRNAQDKTTVDTSEIATSAAKSQIADVVLTINRSAEDEAQGKTRIFVAKLRNSKGRFEICIPSDLSRMQFYDVARAYEQRA